jgi:hypothetical protein
MLVPKNALVGARLSEHVPKFRKSCPTLYSGPCSGVRDSTVDQICFSKRPFHLQHVANLKESPEMKSSLFSTSTTMGVDFLKVVFCRFLCARPGVKNLFEGGKLFWGRSCEKNVRFLKQFNLYCGCVL